MAPTTFDTFRENFHNIGPQLPAYIEDAEYRSVLRQVFMFDPEKKSHFGDDPDKMNLFADDIDETTMDELSYDCDQMRHGLEFMMATGELEPMLKEIYQYAAGKIMSEDIDMGQILLCNYEYFPLYYAVIYNLLFGNPDPKPQALLVLYDCIVVATQLKMKRRGII